VTTNRHVWLRLCPVTRLCEDRAAKILRLDTVFRDSRVTRLWMTPFRIRRSYPILAALHLSRPHFSQLTTTFSSSFTRAILSLDAGHGPS